MIQTRSQPRRSSGGAVAFPGARLLTAFVAVGLIGAASGCAPSVPDPVVDESPDFDTGPPVQLPAPGDLSTDPSQTPDFSAGLALGSLSDAPQESQFEARGFELRADHEDDPTQASMLRFERHFRRGDFAAALKAIDPLVREHPDDPHILFNAAATHRAAGDSIRAAPLLEHVIALDPGHVAARKLLCIILTEEGRTATAIAQLDPLLAAGSLDAEVHALRAAARLRAGNLSEAEADAKRSLELDPQMHKALLVRCALRIDKGDLEGAQSDLEAARSAGALELNCRPLAQVLLRRTAATQNAAQPPQQP